MRRPRAVPRKHTSGRLRVTVRAYYGALPLTSAERGAGERRETVGMEFDELACTRKHRPEAA